MLEKTFESPLDCKGIQPVNPKGNQSLIFIGRTDVEAEALVLWLPDVKSWLIRKDPDTGKDWRQEEKGMTEDEMVGWHHQLNGHEFDQAPGVGDGQGSLACCSPWGLEELDTTERLNWTDNPAIAFLGFYFFLIFFEFYFWLCWVFLAAVASLVAGVGFSSMLWAGFLLRWRVWWWSAGSRSLVTAVAAPGSGVVVHGFSCSVACGILPERDWTGAPALAGRFPSTVPPGKHSLRFFTKKNRKRCSQKDPWKIFIAACPCQFRLL